MLDRVTLPVEAPGPHEALGYVCAELSHRFNIHHATLQVEVSSDACKLAPAELV